MENKQITYREFKKIIVNCLKENHAYDRFKNNLIEQHQSEFNNLYPFFDILSLSSFKKILDGSKYKDSYNYHINEVINYAFTWSDTKEGHEFWCQLDEKWRKKMTNYKIFIDNEKPFQTHNHNNNTD